MESTLNGINIKTVAYHRWFQWSINRLMAALVPLAAPALIRTQPLRRALIRAVLIGICAAVLVVQAPAALAAPHAPGELDPTFAGFENDGISFAADIRSVSSVALLPDGGFVAVGPTQTTNQLGVFRYGPSGRRNVDFGDSGRAIFSDLFTASIVAIQSDGRIVVGGTRNDEFHLARLTPTGVLDMSFDGDGWLADVDPQLSVLQDILVQSDGKIVACGSANFSGDSDFGVARYNADGSRDTSFSDDGKLTIPFGGDDVCASVVQQNDGKLVLAGGRDSTSSFGDDDFAVARLSSNGTLDGSFDGDGKLTTGFGGDEGATDVALQPDGKIVVLGSRFSPLNSYIARYLPNGALDSTFDGDGKRTIPVDRLTALALQPDGKLLALGYHKNSYRYNFALYRLHLNGALDTSFDYDGSAWLDFGDYDKGEALAVLPDGRILVAGAKDSYGALARLWPDGTTFDTGGKLTHAPALFSPGSDEFANALAVQSDGKLLVAGEVRNPAGTASAAFLTRFFGDGQLDTSFGIQGKGTTLALGGAFSVAKAVAVQPDGKIVIAGYTTGSGGTDDFLITRFHPDGTGDATFGDNGIKVVHFGAGHDRANALAVTPDGKIVVAGTVFNGWVDIWGVLRLTSAGQLDPTFGPNHDGKAFVHPKDLATSAAHAVVVQPDKKIVVAGHINFNAAIARLEETGTADSSFGAGGLSIKDLGGNDGINALLLAPNGWFYAAGSAFSFQNNTNDFALAQFRPNGTLAECLGATSCGYWSTGTAFVNWGGNDIAYALDWRGDNQVVAAGFSDGRFAAAQFSTTDAAPSPLTFSTDFVGGYEVGTGVKFTGSNKIVVAGLQEYNADWNVALARFQTTAYTNGSTTLAPADEQTAQDATTPATAPTPLLAPGSSEVDLPDMPQ
jgi:uncharacterized delta-60 repeat protein